MRTKSLLLAAAALAAGVLSSQAQTVYSANIVGYVNTQLPSGYSLINNPLLSSDGTNGAENVLGGSLQAFDSLLIWNGTGYTVYSYQGPGSWTDASGNPIAAPTISPGNAVFYQNNSGAAESNTFVGTVILTNTVALPAGYSFVASTVPISGLADSTNFNLPFQAFDSILFWNGAGYTAYSYQGPGSWTDSTGAAVTAPTISVGEGFFYQNNSGAAETWSQTNVVVQ
jgi:hypothetical protein